MTDDNIEESIMIRKVYMLPRELVDRIATFQQDKKLPSEVEAVRRLLDEALKYRDSPALIVERIKERLKVIGLIHSIGNDVLREHPLVAVIDQSEPDYITFTMKDRRTFRVRSDGYAEEQDHKHFEQWDEFPPKPKAIVKRPDFDDDIPF